MWQNKVTVHKLDNGCTCYRVTRKKLIKRGNKTDVDVYARQYLSKSGVWRKMIEGDTIQYFLEEKKDKQ